MLPRERVIAALEHREPDRIPWGEHSINYNVYEAILGRPSFVQAQFRQTKAYWDGRRDEIIESHKRDKIDLVRALEMDVICVNEVPPKGYQPRPMEKVDEETYRDEDGSLYRISATTHDLMPWKLDTSRYVPPTAKSLQERIETIDSEPLPDVNDSRFELVNHVVKQLKATHYVVLLCGDLEWPRFGATEEESWMNLLLEPDICRKIAELRRKELIRMVPVYAALGADGIMPCGDLGSSTALMASPRIYREMCYPVHQAHVAEAHKHGLKVLKHCCGHVWPVIDELAEVYDAYEGIQASAGMDIKRLKERVRGKLCLWGGIWHEHIVLGGVSDIRSDARYAFRYAAPGGGYIMGSSHSLSVGARIENILEMKRCRDQWGVYPIDPRRFR
jgi:uroporphyrinogen decarboxylase